MADDPKPSASMNDLQASQLISKSLMMQLTEEEHVLVDAHVEQCDPTKQFANLSQVIQDSVAQHCRSTETKSDSESMPADCRSRLQESIRLALDSPTAQIPSARGQETVTREGQEDERLAAQLLHAGLISERRLQQVLGAWTPDSGALPELLVRSGSISPEQLDAIQQRDDVSGEIMQGLAGSKSLAFMQQKLERATARGGHRQVNARFTLLRKLAEGGLGIVWIARDETLKRIVAVKEMHAAAARSEKAWLRFHREAEITGHLEHPNVVPLYLFGSDGQTHNPFYAMRFVGKRTLSDAIAEYHDRRQAGENMTLELHRLLTAFLGVCQAIAYAHSRGVIHRDLKPENIALDAFGQVFVLDWGLAKLSHSAELATQLTLAHVDGVESVMDRTIDGEVIGTPLYMAPEQASGDAENVDERTDVYGLGAILFAILTGDAPHAQSLVSAANQSVEQALKVIAAAESPTPRSINPQTPIDLDSVCRRAMSHKPYSRFASASELANQVESWLAGQRGKEKLYDDMRMTGRELRANLLTSVWDLSTNVRFMGNLPSIHGIIDATLRPSDRDDELKVWRERLATVYQGLLGANRDYLSVAYSAVSGDEVHELVRAERHSADQSNIRIVPKSRMMTYHHTPFSELVWSQNPEEVSLDMTEDCRCPNTITCSMRIVAGTPVFDQHTEEPFGFVTIECDLARVLDRQATLRRSDDADIFVVAPNGTVVMHSSHNSNAGIVGQPFAVVAPQHAARLNQGLQFAREYIDETDRELYATRVELSRRESITIVLCRR